MPSAWDNLTSKNVSVGDQQGNKLPRIAIGIPYNSKWEPEWVEKTYRFLRCIPVNWCEKVVFYSKVPSLPVARSVLVNQALSTNCDYLFFLDTDLIFETPEDPNVALLTLYQAINKDPNSKDGKMASGLYRAKQKQGFNFCMWNRANEKGFGPIEKWTGNWIITDVAGLGCSLIAMEVFRNTPKPWFYWEDHDGISEDFWFFELAKKYGYNLHIMTDVKLSHLGGLKVKSDGSIVTPDM